VKRLTGFQKKALKAKAHHLKPVILIGQKGLTEDLIQSVHEALEAHELIKIKFLDHKEKQEKSDILSALELRTKSLRVGLIGHTAIYFRPHPDPEKRKILIPGTNPAKGKTPLGT
jgi:RNA-binding protein